MSDSYDVFISYSNQDEKIASELCSELANVGFSCFMAEKGIHVSEKWEQKIREALKSSEQILLLITPRSINSQWVLMETGAAWILQKKLIPLLLFLTPDDLPNPICQYQARLIETRSQINSLINEMVEKKPKGFSRGSNVSPESISFQDVLAELTCTIQKMFQENWVPDIIIGSGRGGGICAGILSASLGHKSFKIVDCHFKWEQSDRVTTIDTSSLKSDNLSGKKILIVESTRQSGETHKLIVKEIRKYKPDEIKSLALVWRTGAPSKPDYYAFHLDFIPKMPWDLGFLYYPHSHYKEDYEK